MFFQFSPPVVPKKSTEDKVKNESEEVAVLRLAAFSKNPKVFFENVVVENRAVRTLIIKNPSKHEVEITIKEDIPPEIDVSLSWWQRIIEPDQEVSLEIFWIPHVEGAWRHVLLLSDGGRKPREIPIAFKSIMPKKCKKKSQQLPKYKVKSPVHKSHKRISPVKHLYVKPNKPRIIVTGASKEKLVNIENKENCAFIPGPRKNFQDIQRESNLRRETYAVQNFKTDLNITSHSDEFNDSLETPKINIESKLQSASFMFSPVATPKNCIEFKPGHCSTDEKSFDSISHIDTKHVQLFPNAGTSPNVNNRRETYLKVNTSSETFNLSSETYVKGDLSSETYIKGNLSSETYVKGNVSSSTFVTESPLADLTNLQNLQFSPLNMQVSPKPAMNMGVPLSCIVEESFTDHLSLCTKRKSNFMHSTTPHKKPNIEECDTFIREGTCSSTFVVKEGSPRLKRKLNNIDSATPQKRFSDWSVQGSGLRITKKTSGLSLLTRLDETELKTLDIKEVSISNPFLLATTENIDSLATPLCFDENWMNEQEVNFKKWLNSLLTPPAEFELKEEEQPLDIVKHWKQCCLKKEVEAAPTREVVSNEYHTNARLNRLRQNAKLLLRSVEIHGVVTKVVAAIDSDKLMIRKDRDIHLDLSLQKEILSIILSYNPLWLRVGLETVYKEIIPMNSNSDLRSLISFISERFFKNPALLRRYKSVHSPKYCSEIKKFIFKKFLTLVYFLDQAKTRKLIQHDPCLFCKSAAIKESREAILKFSKESVFAMGDITKFLKYLGYIVQHKQTYIDEFDYAVTSLGVDLRDGVRLTRVMEIILLRNDLGQKLRVPAISRLQKIHNVKLVFDALNDAGFGIKGEISPKDIVNGHKEKTLFFLWQIIHKFEAPLMVKSATSIQKWWRSAPILTKRLKLRKIFLEKSAAATRIQIWYRHKKLAAELERFVDLARLYMKRRNLERNAIKLQSYYRMYLARKKYLRIVHCIIGIQREARQWLENGNQQKRHLAATKIQSCVRMFIARRRFQKLKYTVLQIQILHKANRLTKLARSEFLELKAAAIFVQNRFRANRLCRETRNYFVELKAAAILLQRRFRANRMSKHAQTEFLELKAATIFIQRRFRANKLCQRVHYEFLELKAATIFIQQQFKANRLCRSAQTRFIELKAVTILIQRRFRSYKLCKETRSEFQNLKAATISIQRRFRADRLGRNVRGEFLELKAIAIFVQQRFRANRLCREARGEFLRLKTAVISMQQLFRANKLCNESRTRFLEMKAATILVQRRFRANRLCQQSRDEFLELKSVALLIQRRFRAIKLCRKARTEFLELKTAVLSIQRRFRANRLGEEVQMEFLGLKRAVIFTQRRFRANRLRREAQTEFLDLKAAVICVQRRFRANRLSRKIRNEFLVLKTAVIFIQQRFRANRLCKTARIEFTELKTSAVFIQRHFRAKLLCREAQKRFLDLKAASLCIQRRFRANRDCKRVRAEFLELKTATVSLQRRFRANTLCRDTRTEFLRLKTATISIQQHFRANKLCRADRATFLKLKAAAVIIQRRFRGNRLCRTARKEFLLLKASAVCIQQHFRAFKLSRETRTQFLKLKTATVSLQRRFRSNKQSKEARMEFLKMKRSSICIQQRFRANRLCKRARIEFIELKAGVVFIQRRFRANLLCKEAQRRFLNLKAATVFIQRRFRTNRDCRRARTEFLELKTATLCLQKRFRANTLCKNSRAEFLRLKTATISIQQRFRANKLCREDRATFLELKTAAIFIQRRFRANKLCRAARKEFLQLKASTVCIQQHFRAYKLSRETRFRFFELKRATVSLQRRFRSNRLCREARMEFLEMKRASVCIQQRFRANKLCREARFEFLKLKAAAISIQRRFKANKLCRECSSEFLKLKAATVFVQRRFRANKLGKEARILFLQFKTATIFVQRRFRANRLCTLARKNFLELKEATIIVQRRFRANIVKKTERNRYLELRNAVMTVQRRFRATLAMKQQRAWYLQIRNATMVIQRFYRNYCSPEAIQRRKENAAAIKIQARWKGYVVRLRQNHDMVKIRARLRKANIVAKPENTLAARRKKACAILSNDNHSVLEIWKALEDLEFITRRCQSTCLKLSKTLFIDGLYTTIASTNRSPAENMVSTLAAHILINLYKYKHTRAKCWLPEHIGEILTVMVHCCDKEDKLFPTLCTLLWLFAHNEEYKRVIVNSDNFEQKLNKMQSLCDRKKKMVGKTVQKFDSLFKSEQNPPVPSLKPDWGLERMNRPKVFVNSMQAIHCLQAQLRSYH